MRTEVTSSNPRDSTQQLVSSVLGRDMMEASADNALARSHSRSRSLVPNTQQSVHRTARHPSSSYMNDQLQSNMDTVAVVERVVTVVMDKLHPPVSITENLDNFAHLVTMRDQARVSGDQVIEHYANAMLQKLTNKANATE